MFETAGAFHTRDTFRSYRPRPDAYRMLNNRIGLFINLPFASLDKLTLQKRLEEIGEDKPDESA